MIIKQIYCKGYRRFLNADFKNVDITFSSVLSLIIGDNGSGKSSLMELFGLVPPERKDFKEGGKLQFLVLREGSEYKIKYSIKKAVHCEFYKDGVELNHGHTGKIQSELIKEHLGYTKEIHQLMTDDIPFTQMSPARRREWFTEMSSVDMSYILKVYKDARIKARDVKGALRTVDERIAQTESKIAAHQLNDGAIEQISKLAEQINTLLRMANKDLPDVDVAAYTLESQQNELQELLKTAKRLEVTFNPNPAFNNMPDIESRLTTVNLQKSNLLESIEKHNSELFEINRIKDQIKAASNEDTESLGGRLALLEERISSYPVCKTYEHVGDPERLIQETKSIESTFMAYITSLPLNVRPEGSNLDWTEWRNELRNVTERTVRLNQSLSSIQGTLTHLSHTPEEECPNCNHKFHKNYSPSQIAKLNDDKGKLEEELASLQDIANNLTEKVTAVDEYIDYVKQFKAIRTQSGLLNPLWEGIVKAGHLDTTPSQAINMFNAWATSVVVYQSKVRDTVEYDRIKSIIDELSALKQHNDPVFIDRRTKELELAIDKEESMIKEFNEEITELSLFKSNVSKYTSVMNNVEELCKSIDYSASILVDSTINKHVNLEIIDKQGKLAILRQNQNSYESLTAVLSDLNESKAELQVKDEHWKVVVQGLSPETGLIAKQIKGHIGTYIARMNAIISKIWTYDLTVLPCDVDSTGLDYKFPLVIPSKKHESKDVRLGSKGQKDVIDFAFKMVAMEYLGISDFPLFLDELGSSFDAAHQNNLMQYINYLIATKRSDQMFVINHFTSMWGGFSDSEVLVMDSDNIIVPDSYNTHVNVEGKEID